MNTVRTYRVQVCDFMTGEVLEESKVTGLPVAPYQHGVWLADKHGSDVIIRVIETSDEVRE